MERKERTVATERHFFLKQVDPMVVAKKYLSKSLTLPTEKITINITMPTPDIQVGKDSSSETYEIVDKSGEILRMVTTDHEKWKRNGTDKSNSGYTCHWCRASFVGEHLIIPIRIDRDLSTNKLLFSGTGSYCSFECAYASLKTKWYCGFYQRDPLYSDAETLLRFMFYRFTNKETLIAAPDWTLYYKNGGPLSDKDFYSSHHTYVPTSNIILNVAKVSYLQLEK